MVFVQRHESLLMKSFGRQIYWHGQGEKLCIDCVLDLVLTWIMERLILAK